MSDYQQGSSGPPPTPFGGPGGATAAPPGSPQAYNPPPQAPQQGYAQQYGQPGTGGQPGGQPGYPPQGYGQPGPGGQPGYGAAGFAQPGANGKGDPIAWLTVVSSVLLIIGTFLPWIDLGPITLNGLDAEDGVIVIVLATILLVAGVVRARLRFRWVSIVALLFALFTLLAVVIDVGSVSDVGATVGIGLWVCLVGAIGATLGTLITLRKT